MEKNLLIFSGSTDPEIDKYKKRYDLVISEAKKRGYDKIKLVGWTGQKSSNSKGTFSMQNAVIDAIIEVEKFNKLGRCFDLIAFSWGCGVALRSMQLLQDKMNYLDRIILWGVSPFWIEYEAMEVNKHQSITNAYIHAGCIVDKEYLTHQIPIEFLLHAYRSDKKLKVGAGSENGDSNFLKYIESIVSNKNISFHYFDNLDHSVKEPNDYYFNFLFN